MPYDTTKVWLHTALSCNHQSFACPSYSLVSGFRYKMVTDLITQYVKYLIRIPQLQERGYICWNCAATMYYRVVYKYPCLWMNFWLPCASHNVENSFIKFLVLENMDVTVGFVIPIVIFEAELRGWRIILPPSSPAMLLYKVTKALYYPGEC